jgi:hypothetical protein
MMQVRLEQRLNTTSEQAQSMSGISGARADRLDWRLT